MLGGKEDLVDILGLINKMNNKIPDKLYEQICENMPVLCIDVIVLHEGKVLLIQRKEEPEKGNWWFVGGRIHKNEVFGEAAKRKVFEETGLRVKIIKKMDLYNYKFQRSRFPNLTDGLHTPTLVFLVEPIGEVKIRLDGTILNYRWVTHIEEGLPYFVKRILRDSRVFK